MDWLKKNRWFAVLLALSALSIVGEAGQVYSVRQRALRAAVQLQAKRQELDWLAHRSPALSEENVLAIAADVAAHERKVAELRASLPGSGDWWSAPPAVPRESYFALGRFSQHLKALAVAQHVVLRTDERFGFATYGHEGPEVEMLASVHRQRVVIQHLVETLFEARPQALLGVQRERPRAAASLAVSTAAMPSGAAASSAPVPAPARGREESADFFAPAARLRVPASDLLTGELFRLEFTGQTRTLRAFLNALVASPLPLTVRAVEVAPANAAAAAGERAAASPLDAPVPLVPETSARFTVVVECLAVVPAADGATP